MDCNGGKPCNGHHHGNNPPHYRHPSPAARGVRTFRIEIPPPMPAIAFMKPRPCPAVVGAGPLLASEWIRAGSARRPDAEHDEQARPAQLTRKSRPCLLALHAYGALAR